MKLQKKPLLAVLSLILGLAAGCSTDEASSPTAPPANPVPPQAGVAVSLTATTTVLEANSTDPSILTVRATRSDNGQPVPNLTQATVTTTLGSFGSVGGPQTVTLELINGEATVALFPGGTIGTASVRAQVNNGVGILQINVREEGQGGTTFFINSVSPNTGSPQGGDTVTISGAGFSDPIRVTFDNIPATIQSASESQIRVTTPPLLEGLPAGGTRAVTVSVTINRNEANEATDTLPSGFIYVNGGGGGGTLQPTIFSITPASGPNEGGTQVTINGDGFEAPVQVKFGSGTNDAGFNGAEAQVLSVTRTRIVVVAPPTSCAPPCAPPNPNQLVNILVKNTSSGRSTVATSAFRYGSQIIVTAISPGEGPPSGGTLVTIFGQGFDEPVAVTLAGRGQQVISVSGSEIVARTVAVPITGCGGNLTGATSVTNIETGASATGPAFSYVIPQQAIFSIAPSSGPQAGNTQVTILGTNLNNPHVVEFVVGGTAFSGTVQSNGTSSITARTPAIPNSVLNTAACDENGDPVPPDPTPDPEGERYLPTTATVRVIDTTTGCTMTLNNAFVFNPTDTTCRGD